MIKDAQKISKPCSRYPTSMTNVDKTRTILYGGTFSEKDLDNLR